LNEDAAAAPAAPACGAKPYRARKWAARQEKERREEFFFSKIAFLKPK
jgi:hypothetical protein